MRFPKKNYYKLFTIEYEMMRPIHFVFDIEVRKLIEVIQCNALLNFNYGTILILCKSCGGGEDGRDLLCLLGGSRMPWLLFAVPPS